MKTFKVILSTIMALFIGPFGTLFVSFSAFLTLLIAPMLVLSFMGLSILYAKYNPESEAATVIGGINLVFLLFALPTLGAYNLICAIVTLIVGFRRKEEIKDKSHKKEMIITDSFKPMTVNNNARTINEMY